MTEVSPNITTLCAGGPALGRSARRNANSTSAKQAVIGLGELSPSTNTYAGSIKEKHRTHIDLAFHLDVVTMSFHIFTQHS